MLNYSAARDMMKTARQGRRKLANNTYLVAGKDAASFAIRLHATDVVTMAPDGSFTLNSGGWRTVTTKERINAFSPVNVGSDRGQWYVYPRRGDWSYRFPFADGMTIAADGSVTGGVDESAIRRAILNSIRAYVDGFVASVVAAGGLTPPSGGDCWGCAMRTKKEGCHPGKAPWGQDKATKPGADHFMGVGHIFSHFEEKYYVPSLLWDALQRRGNPSFCWAMMDADVRNGRTDMLRADLRAYFKKLMSALVGFKIRGEVA